MKIYLVAGEVSGDLLGEDLIHQLKELFPNAEFRGLGGEQMQTAGLTSLYPLEALSVMGIFAVLKRLPQILNIRKHLYQDALAWGADIFIGIDAPDFNLGLAKKLHQKKIPTVHYVSPSVWAWRQGRIKGIKQSVDLMLSILPFELAFYQQHQQACQFIGHPAADRIPLAANKAAAKEQLGIAANTQVIALLPGSRSAEVNYLAPTFLQTANLIQQQQPEVKFLLPSANTARHQQLEAIIQQSSLAKKLNLQLIAGQSSEALAAADAALLASGTASLEALLHKTPMVISYKASQITWWLSRWLLKTPWVGLPNLLAQEEIVAEKLQQQATPEILSEEVLKLLGTQGQLQVEKFHQLHLSIQCDASKKAAQAIAELLKQKSFS